MTRADDPRWVEVPLFGPDELAALRALDQKFIDSWADVLPQHLVDPTADQPPVAEAPTPRPEGAASASEGDGARDLWDQDADRSDT